MGADDPLLALRREAAELLAGLRHAKLNRAEDLLLDLRRAREFELMTRLAEAVSRRRPAKPRLRRLYAQGLIETGLATAAEDVLQRALAVTPRSEPEWAELVG